MGNHIILTNFLTPNLAFLINAGIIVNPKSESFDVKSPLFMPLSFWLTYFPAKNLGLYSSLTYAQNLATIPWATDDKYYRRGSYLNAGLGLQLTFLRAYSLYGQYQYNIHEEFEFGANTIQFGLRLRFN